MNATRIAIGLLLLLVLVMGAIGLVHGVRPQRSGPALEGGATASGAILSAQEESDRAAPPGAPESPPPEDAAPGVMVEVQGAVKKPGFYTLPAGARLYEALRKAGGATGNAAMSDLNIAARLIDGSVVSVPFQRMAAGGAPLAAADLNPPEYTRSGWAAAEGGSESTAPSGGAPAPGLVNLNTAGQVELERLPGVGPKTAQKIIRYRDQQVFRSVDDLRHVPGIGDKRLATLRPLVTVQ